MHHTARDPRIGLILIGFGPIGPLTAIARQLGWTEQVLSDPDRLLYHRLGIGRAPWWRIYTPATLATYARALRHGTRLSRPATDTRQLGADAIARGHTVVAVWRPRSPDDRPEATAVIGQAARTLLATPPA